MKYLKTLILYLVIIELVYFLLSIVFYGSNTFLPLTRFNDPPLYYDMDSLYGVTRQKSTKQLINRPWGGILHETNSLGFRDSEFNRNNTLVLGNSFIEGYGVNKKDRFTELLEKNTGLDIDNAAFSGVWSPIQSVILLEDLMINRNIHYKHVKLFITSSELMNIGKRNPNNDMNRNYPYKYNDSICFHKASKSSFQNSISSIDKIKRFSKSLFVFKLYNSVKYYGASKFSKKEMTFDETKLNWLLKVINHKAFNTKIDIIIINNLNRRYIKNIDTFKPSVPLNKITVETINFPDNLNNYFMANGHLNEEGHKELGKLVKHCFK